MVVSRANSSRKHRQRQTASSDTQVIWCQGTAKGLLLPRARRARSPDGPHQQVLSSRVWGDSQTLVMVHQQPWAWEERKQTQGLPWSQLASHAHDARPATHTWEMQEPKILQTVHSTAAGLLPKLSHLFLSASRYAEMHRFVINISFHQLSQSLA